MTRYFGYVKVVASPPASDGSVVSVGLTTYGVRIEKGIGIGYFDEHRIYVPLDCRLAIVVANEIQLEKAVNMLSASLKEGACVAWEL